ncbi:MAG TPA: chemotaxis protein CheW [Polyangiaceae bacterium]|nr:chemotaxis protein CheW [Polyangiaceae bacterium]
MNLNTMLLCRARARLCALPLGHVIETMRPLPLRPLGGMPSFVKGVSVIRDAPIPVVDLGAVLGLEDDARPERLLTVRAGERHVALAVESVIGVRTVDVTALDVFPPLLGESNADKVALLGALQGELLLVLRAGRLVPESIWAELARGNSES